MTESTNKEPGLASINQDQETINAEKAINEEYKIWKKNSPFLYDLVITHALMWPTLTVQWFPDMQTTATAAIHRLLVGTHTSEGQQNYVQIMQVAQPLESESKQETPVYGSAECKITTIQKIKHDGEVNRARYMPQNCNLIATRTVAGPVYVFDRTKHPSTPNAEVGCIPDIKLVGHTREGYGLSWSKSSEGRLLSAGEDGIVMYWDIKSVSRQNQEIEAVGKFSGHAGWIEDVAWHESISHLFGSVGDDKKLILWDVRIDKPSSTVTAHDAEVNCVSFSPANPHTIALWDMRNLGRKLHSFASHTDEILQLQWSPHSPTVFASAAADRRLNVWDIARIGEEQSQEDAADGPPELLFVHGGHTNKISDFSWNPQQQWALCSVAEDNICQVWQMAKHIYADPDLEVDGVIVC